MIKHKNYSQGQEQHQVSSGHTLNFSIFLGLLFLLVLVYWQWWGWGPRVGGDFPIVSQEYLKSQLDLPRVWSDRNSGALGQYSAFTLWSWPFNFLIGVLAYLGFNFELLERILFIVPIILVGSLGIWRLAALYGLSNSAKFVATFFYLTNTYLLLLIDGGQLSIALSFAYFPLCFSLIIESIQGNWNKKFLAAVAVSLLGVFDIRFIYILSLLTLIKFLLDLVNSERKKDQLFNYSKMGSAVVLMLLGFNAYWLLPLIFSPPNQTLFSLLTQTSVNNSLNLGHAILLLAPNWPKNIFGVVTDLKWEFILIPLLVFIAALTKSKDKTIGFWLIVAMVGIFLTTGFSIPFGSIYSWLFNNLPFFSLFRDSTKFFFLVSLSYSMLLGITVNNLLTMKFLPQKTTRLLLIIIVAYLIWLIDPVWRNQMTGTFSQPPWQKEYLNLTQVISSDQKFSRVLWIPTVTPLGYSGPHHPALDATSLVNSRPFAIGTVGTYETLNFLREEKIAGQLLDIAGIGYVVYPPLDQRRESQVDLDKIKYHQTFLNQLQQLPWVEDSTSAIPLLKTKNHQDQIFAITNLWWVVGSDRLYDELSLNQNFKLSGNGLVFLEEYPNLGSKIELSPQSKVILYHQKPLDLVAGLFKPSELIFPARQLKLATDQSGWWKKEGREVGSWRSFLQQKYGLDNLDFDYGGGWALSEGNHELVIDPKNTKLGGVLLSRIMSSSKGGKIDFYQGDDMIGSVNSYTNDSATIRIKLTGFGAIRDQISEYQNSSFSWVEIGQLKNDLPIKIKTEGKLNVVNVLAVVDQTKLSNLKTSISQLENQKRIIDWEKLDEQSRNQLFVAQSPAKISWQKMNSTHYKIKVSKIEQPFILALSQNFDTNWEVNNSGPIPLYSLINGFQITNPGEYDLIYRPQTLTDLGLIISAVTLLVASFFLTAKKDIINFNELFRRGSKHSYN